QRLEVAVPEDGVETSGHLGLGLAGGEELRQATDARRAGAVGQDLGQLADEVGQVAGLAALGQALPFGTDDVEAALDEPAQVGEACLDLLTLAAHLPNVSNRLLLEIPQIFGPEDAIELRGHQRN